MPVDRTNVHPKYHKYLDGNVSIHRDDAGEIIGIVGESRAGHYPIEVPPYLLGRAIHRLVYNYDPHRNNGRGPEHDEVTREFLAGFFRLKLE